MVKVKYIGHLASCRIKVGSAIFKNWSKGEIKDLSDETAKKLLLNRDFELVGNLSIKKEKKEEVIEEVINFDLNGDGVVDDKDSSIAGKVLANARKINKEEERK